MYDADDVCQTGYGEKREKLIKKKGDGVYPDHAILNTSVKWSVIYILLISTTLVMLLASSLNKKLLLTDSGWS